MENLQRIDNISPKRSHFWSIALGWQEFSAFLEITVFFVGLARSIRREALAGIDFSLRTTEQMHLSMTLLLLCASRIRCLFNCFASRHLPALYLRVVVSLTSRRDASVSNRGATNGKPRLKLEIVSRHNSVHN